MKNFAKLGMLLLTALLCVAMLLPMSALEIYIVASSEEYESYATSAKYLETIDVMKGFGDGDLHLEDPIQRYQAALFFARVITGNTDESAYVNEKSALYTDVPQYGTIIDLISSKGIIRGYGDGTYGYNDKIKYQDMCAMVVRALGYETESMPAGYPMSYVLKVEELGLDLEGVANGAYLNRGQTAQMVYGALTTGINSYSEEDLKWMEAMGKDPKDSDDTYLRRNFDVSKELTFCVVATENYRLGDSFAFAEKGKVNMQMISYDADGNRQTEDWTIEIEGSPVADVTEADLIGKYFTFVFDDAQPTETKYEKGKAKIIFAEMISADLFENLGELSYVDYDTEKGKRDLLLGKTKLDFTAETLPHIFVYSDSSKTVFEEIDFDALIAKMDANTYFRIEAYDNDDDGEYTGAEDVLVYVPYTFGQFFSRTYKGSAYTMIGKYRAEPVYDMTSAAGKTDENRTHFVEYFVDAAAQSAANTASKSYDDYKPGDTTLAISSSKGEASKTVKLTGKTMASGNFMLYSYNKFSNSLYVAADLGNFQTGRFTGMNASKQQLTIDGDKTSLGLPGTIAGSTGILDDVSGFASIAKMLDNILSNIEEDGDNIKFLEYDSKIIYVEGLDGSDSASADYLILDVEKTFEDYEDTFERGKPWDLPYDGDNVIVKRYDSHTGELKDVKIQSLTYKTGGEEVTVKFESAEDKHTLGSLPDMFAYNLLKANGALYIYEDDDDDAAYELYAYGTEKFVLQGAKVIQGEGGGKTYRTPNENADVTFYFDVSNKFIAENEFNIPTDRITTTAKTRMTVVCADGYVTATGKMSSNTEAKSNRLWLSASALVLWADADGFLIYDPASIAKEDDGSNVYSAMITSFWYSGRKGPAAYYLFGAAAKYVDSSAKLDADGNIETDKNGKKLYEHTYRGLLNLKTFKTENVTLLSTSAAPPVTEIANSIDEVIAVDEDGYATLTNFGDVYVEHGDYRYGGFGWLADKGRIRFVTEPKDVNGNGKIDENEVAQYLSYNTDSDAVYKALKSLKVTFIDLDAGADVDYKKYSFADAYVAHQRNDSNIQHYSEVELDDREVDPSIMLIKRCEFDGSAFSDVVTNGTVSANMKEGKRGLISSQHWFRWNGWSDYLIPAVDKDGDTIWKYEGSLRVKVTYYAFIDYDEKEQTVDCIVVRIGQIMGVVGKDDTFDLKAEVPAALEESYNFDLTAEPEP
ncbi:MAG: S-layer homology domain-containing protein [Clostridia bacterium]|nr:S-layer homology domain-containing protein [Clostridia bacterium]